MCSPPLNPMYKTYWLLEHKFKGLWFSVFHICVSEAQAWGLVISAGLEVCQKQTGDKDNVTTKGI